MKPHHLAVCATAISVALNCGTAFGQAYPTKPVRIITASAGGGLDTIVRIIGAGIQGPLGQSVVIDNRVAQAYPEDMIFRGGPDGQTLGYFANPLWLNAFLRADPPYDPVKDFTHVSLTVTGPNVVVVSLSTPVHSIQELIAYAKSKPGELNVALAADGASSTNASVLLEAAAGIKMTGVRYKGAAESFADLVSGRVQVMTPTTVSVASLIKAGKVRVLAVTSAQRSALTPDLPTVASAGYEGYESVTVHGLIAPPKTPAAIVNRLSQEVNRFLNQPETKAKINALGFDVVAGSPAQLTAAMKSEMDKMGPIFKQAGIKPGGAKD